MAAAVRIARTATGRTTVVGCGYFGWQDWCSRAAGVPAGASADYVEVPFNDVAALEAAVGQDDPDAERLRRVLHAVLGPHNAKEEAVVYPLTDRALDDTARDALVARIQAAA